MFHFLPSTSPPCFSSAFWFTKALNTSTSFHAHPFSGWGHYFVERGCLVFTCHFLALHCAPGSPSGRPCQKKNRKFLNLGKNLQLLFLQLGHVSYLDQLFDSLSLSFVSPHPPFCLTLFFSILLLTLRRDTQMNVCYCHTYLLLLLQPRDQ